MNSPARLLALCILSASLTGTAYARHPAHVVPHHPGPPAPRYLVLRGPTAPVRHHPSYGYYPGRPVVVQPRAYSYGWFGVKSRRHWSRHTGYYGNYREWSAE
jgi:hypothetical protein